MAINTPEELLNRVTEFINIKDLDSFVSLYELEASLVDESGENINGPEKIREKLKGYMDMNGKLESTVRKIIPAGNILQLTAIGRLMALVLTELQSTLVGQQ